MNKKQISDKIINDLQKFGKQYKKPSEKLAYDFGFVVSVLAEICENDPINRSVLNRKLDNLKVEKD